MKKADSFQTSTGETVTISRAEYEDKNARLASQDKRISRLENQVLVLTEALRLARHKQFGASSEKSDESFVEQLSFLFPAAEVFSAAGKEPEECVTVVQLTNGTGSMNTPWIPFGALPVRDMAAGGSKHSRTDGPSGSGKAASLGRTGRMQTK